MLQSKPTRLWERLRDNPLLLWVVRPYYFRFLTEFLRRTLNSESLNRRLSRNENLAWRKGKGRHMRDARNAYQRLASIRDLNWTTNGADRFYVNAQRDKRLPQLKRIMFSKNEFLVTEVYERDGRRMKECCFHHCNNLPLRKVKCLKRDMKVKMNNYN